MKHFYRSKQQKWTIIYLDALLKICFAWSHHAKSALLLQPAVGIVIGDSGRDSHSTGF